MAKPKPAASQAYANPFSQARRAWRTRLIFVGAFLSIGLATTIYLLRPKTVRHHVDEAEEAAATGNAKSAVKHFQAAADVANEPSQRLEMLQRAADLISQRLSHRWQTPTRNTQPDQPGIATVNLVDTRKDLTALRRILARGSAVPAPNNHMPAEQLALQYQVTTLLTPTPESWRELRQAIDKLPPDQPLAAKSQLLAELQNNPPPAQELLLERLDACPPELIDANLLVSLWRALAATSPNPRIALARIEQRLDRPSLDVAPAAIQFAMATLAVATAPTDERQQAFEELHTWLKSATPPPQVSDLVVATRVLAASSRKLTVTTDGSLSTSGLQLANQLLDAVTPNRDDPRFIALQAEIAYYHGDLQRAQQLLQRALGFPGTAPVADVPPHAPIVLLATIVNHAQLLATVYLDRLVYDSRADANRLTQQLAALDEWLKPLADLSKDARRKSRIAFRSGHWHDAAKVLLKGPPVDQLLAAEALLAAGEYGAVQEILTTVSTSRLPPLRRVAVARRLVEALIQTGNAESAVAVITPLAEALEHYAPLQTTLARAQIAAGDLTAATTTLAKLPPNSAPQLRLLYALHKNQETPATALKDLPVSPDGLYLWRLAVSRDERLLADVRAWLNAAARATPADPVLQILAEDSLHSGAPALLRLANLAAAVGLPPSQQAIALAREALRNGDLTAATAWLAKTNPQSPADAEKVVALKLQLHSATGEFDAAAALLANSQTTLSRALSTFWQAQLASATASPDTVVDQLRSFTREYPFHSDGWTRLGDALLQTGNVFEARSAYHTALDQRPDHPTAMRALGDLLIADNSREQALKLITKRLRLSRTTADLDHCLGQLVRLDQTDTVIKFRRRLAETTPHDYHNRRQLARLLIASDNQTDAAAVVDDLVTAAPDNLRNRLFAWQTQAPTSPVDNAAVIAFAEQLRSTFNRGDWEQLLAFAHSRNDPRLIDDLYRQAMATGADLGMDYAQWLRDTLRPTDSFAVYQKLWQQGHLPAGVALVEFLIQTDRSAEATPILQALESKVDGATAFRLEALRALADGDTDAALSSVNQAIETAPYASPPRLLRALLTSADPRRIEQTRADFQIAMRLAPNDAKVRLQFIDWLFTQQDYTMIAELIGDRYADVFELRRAKLEIAKYQFPAARDRLLRLTSGAYAPYALRYLLAMAKTDGRFDLLFQAHQQLADRLPDDPIVLNNFGLCAIYSGDPETGVRALRHGIAQLPANSPLRPYLTDTLGLGLLRLGNYSEAGPHLVQSCTSGNLPISCLYLAALYVVTDQHDQSREPVANALSHLPNAADATDEFRTALTDFCLHLDSRPLAVAIRDYLNRFASGTVLASGATPTNNRLLAAVADVNARILGDADAANQLFRQAVEGNDDPLIHLLYARFFIGEGKPDLANRHVAVAKRPDRQLLPIEADLLEAIELNQRRW